MKKLRYFIGTIFILCMIAYFPSMAATTVRLPLTVEEDYTRAQELLPLVNSYRNTSQEPALQMDSQLQDIAMQRAAELAVLFAHDRPDGSGMIRADIATGENIANGQGTAQMVFNDWKSSPVHASCMIDRDAKYCGIGCVVYESTRFWVFLIRNDLMGSTNIKTGIVTNQRDVDADISKFKFYIWDWKLPDNEMYVNTGGIYYGTSQQAGIFIHDFYNDSEVGCRMYPQMLLYSTDTPGILSVAADGTVTPKKTGEGSINVALKEYPSVKTTIPVSVIANTRRENGKGNLTINMVGGSNYTYTGQPVTPGFDIRDCFGLQLVRDRDYRVEYSNNTNPGTATAKVKLIGNYACPELSAMLGFDADVYTRNCYISGGTSGAGNGSTGAASWNPGINPGGTGAGVQPLVSPISGSTAGMGTSSAYDDSRDTVSSKLQKAAVSSVKVAGKGKASVRWQKKAGISGYEVQYALNKKFTQDVKTKKVSGQKKTGVTLKKLKGKKTYYVRVRTYKKSKGKVVYSKWSGMKKIRIK